MESDRVKYEPIGFDLERGFKIYYSKIKSLSTIILFTSVLATQLILSIIYDEFLLALLSVIYLLPIFNGIMCSVYKKPVFVYHNGMLRFTKDSTTYDFENYLFEIKYVGKYNFSQSIVIYDLNKNKVLVENLWYLKDNWEVEDIVKKMNLLKLLKIKNTRF